MHERYVEIHRALSADRWDLVKDHVRLAALVASSSADAEKSAIGSPDRLPRSFQTRALNAFLDEIGELGADVEAMLLRAMTHRGRGTPNP